MFELDPRLQNDTVPVGRFRLSQLLLSRDATYPWCILVPERNDITEIHHLDESDQLQLIRESSHLSEVMIGLFDAYKMNVAALGNVVRQLHVHHIARFTDDPAWPGPIWGVVAARAYLPEALAERVERLRNALAGEGFTPF